MMKSFLRHVYNKLFLSDSSAEEILLLLNSFLKGELSSADWDYFISVKNVDSKLDAIRYRMEEITYLKSKYKNAGSISPENLNDEGVAEVRNLINLLIEQIENKNSG